MYTGFGNPSYTADAWGMTTVLHSCETLLQCNIAQYEQQTHWQSAWCASCWLQNDQCMPIKRVYCRKEFTSRGCDVGNGQQVSHMLSQSTQLTTGRLPDKCPELAKRFVHEQLACFPFIWYLTCFKVPCPGSLNFGPGPDWVETLEKAVSHATAMLHHIWCILPIISLMGGHCLGQQGLMLSAELGSRCWLRRSWLRQGTQAMPWVLAMLMGHPLHSTMPHHGLVPSQELKNTSWAVSKSSA